MSGLFDDLLQPLGDRQRDALVSAWAALEYGSEPASEAALPALRDAALRHLLDQMLHRTGRTLVHAGTYLWTSGYRDDIAAELVAKGWGILPPLERAALILVLVHSVAIPRADGRLVGDEWQSPHPTTPTRLRKLSQVHGQRRLSDALQWLRAAGLVRAMRGSDPETAGASYVPGPALRRLTPAARQRLQENLILAVGPDTALATAIMVRRSLARPQK
ncbi:hypothetical protein [Streptomyces sp. NRRL F-4428]|uniref:hypothetical protein n=1 Tax=Streptomyces sp. NRRL F-4428 TaxID=1609137 RepID=UPI0005EC0B81|nr:hypothetical protein [Streptomyces sp. NRRL F-4428]KJK53810.1 hypothetical protein UK14_04975 [Streptomyces sp. NRRL F-4428]